MSDNPESTLTQAPLQDITIRKPDVQIELETPEWTLFSDTKTAKAMEGFLDFLELSHNEKVLFRMLAGTINIGHCWQYMATRKSIPQGVVTNMNNYTAKVIIPDIEKATASCSQLLDGNTAIRLQAQIAEIKSSAGANQLYPSYSTGHKDANKWIYTDSGDADGLLATLIEKTIMTEPRMQLIRNAADALLILLTSYEINKAAAYYKDGPKLDEDQQKAYDRLKQAGADFMVGLMNDSSYLTADNSRLLEAVILYLKHKIEYFPNGMVAILPDQLYRTIHEVDTD